MKKNMKTYVFIIRRITYISGAVQYVYNKTRYLESKGWRVLIFSALHGPLYVDFFKKYKNHIYPQLYLTPQCFRKKDVCNVVGHIVSTIGNCEGDTCIVESDALQRAVWAELVAQRLKCRHLALFVRESHYFFDATALEFLRFKYDRHELAGIAEESICQILYDNHVEKRTDTRFRPYCQNVIEDIEDNYSSLLDERADVNLGYLGRLEKECVPTIVEGMCSYIERYPKKKINVLFIGGSTQTKRVSSIRERFADYPNVRLVMTGNMYPIPLSFAKKIDVFVSTAGAAGATYDMGIPTIRVNPLNGHPVGVTGLDYMPGEKGMYESSPDYKLEDCIERAITQKVQIVFTTKIDEYYRIMYEEFERQLTFANNAQTDTYFDEKKLLQITAAKKYWRVYWLTGHLLGAKGVEYYWHIRHSPKDPFANFSSANYV